MLGTFQVVTIWEWVDMVTSEQKPRVLLNVLQYAGGTCNKELSSRNVSSVEGEKLLPRVITNVQNNLKVYLMGRSH